LIFDKRTDKKYVGSFFMADSLNVLCYLTNWLAWVVYCFNDRYCCV